MVRITQDSSFQYDPCQKNQTLDHAKTQNAPHLHAACIGLLLTVITSYTLQKPSSWAAPHMQRVLTHLLCNCLIFKS